MAHSRTCSRWKARPRGSWTTPGAGKRSSRTISTTPAYRSAIVARSFRSHRSAPHSSRWNAAAASSVLQPRGAPVDDHRDVGHAIPGSGRRRTSFGRPLDGRARPVANAQLRDGAEGRGPAGSKAQQQREETGSDVGPTQSRQQPGRGGHREPTIGEPQHELPDRPPLCVVRLEQSGTGEIAADQRELPGQVRCILDAGVHALRANRAVHVGGVAGEKGATSRIATGTAMGKPKR